MLVCDWLEQTDKNNWVDPEYFSGENDLCRAILPDCLGILSSTLCQISALKEAIDSYVCDNTIFLKWGIVNVPFCSIYVPFHFYLIIGGCCISLEREKCVGFCVVHFRNIAQHSRE